MPSEAVKPVKDTKLTIEVQIENLHRKRSKIKHGGGKERIAKQHASGKLTARERIDRLVDQQSFQEVGLFARHRSTYFGMAEKEIPADGVVTGCAKIDRRTVHLASQDFTVLGGAAGEVHHAAVSPVLLQASRDLLFELLVS